MIQKTQKSTNGVAFSHKCGVVAALLLPLTGCGGDSSGIAKVVVEGTVTLDGQPIPNGEVRFYPTGDTQGAISGGPIRDGKYIAQGRGGVPVGHHAVEILAFRPGAGANANPEGGPVQQYLPNKYNETTELTADVSGDENPTTIDFALTSR